MCWDLVNNYLLSTIYDSWHKPIGLEGNGSSRYLHHLILSIKDTRSRKKLHCIVRLVFCFPSMAAIQCPALTLQLHVIDMTCAWVLPNAGVYRENSVKCCGVILIKIGNFKIKPKILTNKKEILYHRNYY